MMVHFHSNERHLVVALNSSYLDDPIKSPSEVYSPIFEVILKDRNHVYYKEYHETGLLSYLYIFLTEQDTKI